MSEETEALKLADELENGWAGRMDAAAELRRLHKENERLRDELKEDTGVIAVWRGRTERAESENERLREALSSIAKIMDIAKAALRREDV